MSQNKSKKKARGIIFYGLKTKQCMSHVSTKNKTKHEGVIFGNTKECMTHISTKTQRNARQQYLKRCA